VLRTGRIQDERVFKFYEEYCEADGQLTEDYLKLVYEDDDDKVKEV